MLLCENDIVHDSRQKAPGILGLCCYKSFFRSVIPVENIIIYFKSIQMDPALGGQVKKDTAKFKDDVPEFVLGIQNEDIIISSQQCLQNLCQFDEQGLPGSLIRRIAVLAKEGLPLHLLKPCGQQTAFLLRQRNINRFVNMFNGKTEMVNNIHWAIG